MKWAAATRVLCGIRSLLFLALDPFAARIVCLFRRPEHRCDVLFIRTDAIGDFVLWIDASRAIRDLYKGKVVALVGNALWCDWAAELAVADLIIPLRRARFLSDPLYRWKILGKIRSLQADTAIYFCHEREINVGDAIIRCSGASSRVGSDGNRPLLNTHKLAISDSWYSQLLGLSPPGAWEVERNAEFVRALGCQEYRRNLCRLRKTQLPATRISPDAYFVIFPGAGWPGRMWPVERFLEVARSLVNQRGWTCLVCGSSSEREAADFLLRGLGRSAIDMVGATSLSMLANVVANARLVVTNETSAAQIAALVRTPAVCILGGGHYGRFLPVPKEAADELGVNSICVIHEMPCFNCNWKCVFPRDVGAPTPCIEGVTVESVLAAIERIL